MPEPVTISVTRNFPHTPGRVFDAWLDPGKVGKWMFGPPLREEKVVRMGLEAKIGGRFSFVVNREGKEFNHVGEYLEIDRPSRLVFTWGLKDLSEDPESRVTLEILPAAEGCDLSLSHRIPGEWAEFALRTKEGWTKILASFERYLSREEQH